MRKTSLNKVYEHALKDERIVFIGSDLGAGTLDDFKRDIPERFFMEGVSEAHIVGMATGMAMDGKIVFVNTIATFLTRRCFEQLVNDACLHNVNVRLIGNGGGLVYAPLGPTHLATDDIAILRAIPNMTIVAPSDAEEMKRLIPQTIDWPGPVYIRLAKGGDAIVSRDDLPFEIGRAIEMRTGTDALLVTTGVTLQVALEAAARLEQDGINAGILHMHTVKPLDEEALMARIPNVRAVVSVEEHSIIGGLGSAVAELMAEWDDAAAVKFRRIGVPDAFPQNYGRQDDLMQLFGITPENVASVVSEALV
ncbi:MAG: transketolase [Rhodospirillaceae bacterium]|nr:transketolase [Rhodospirillaceae bacterium]MBT3627653.1 transketolase [Rhodospirillaceae bacterium]MBT4428870.1 transketolase [Rhodospirillaceae bacterium]